jgi:hypothetical protein
MEKKAGKKKTKKKKATAPKPSGKRVPAGKRSVFVYLRTKTHQYLKDMAGDNGVSLSIYLDALVEQAMTKKPLRIGNVIRAKDFMHIEAKPDQKKKPAVDKTKQKKVKVQGFEITI